MDLQKQMNELLELSFNGQIGITTFEERVKKYAETYHTLQLKQTCVIRRYFHPFVGAGSLVKETEKSLVIKLDFNGKEYFAPKNEFTEIM